MKIIKQEKMQSTEAPLIQVGLKAIGESEPTGRDQAKCRRSYRDE